MVSLGRTDLGVFPICLGGNVFGWTADEPQSRAVLDAYTAAGGNFIDTANSYLVEHGRSETTIGRWIAERGNRDQIVLATKVGGGRGAVRNLRAETLEREARASLERLQTDRIDLYYAHFDDERTPLEESLRAFDALVRVGAVRHVGGSNYSAERLFAALELQRGHRLAEFTVLQPHYNLMERKLEHTLLSVAEAWDLAVVPYYGLAKGLPNWENSGRAATPSSPHAPRPRERASNTAVRPRSRRLTRLLRLTRPRLRPSPTIPQFGRCPLTSRSQTMTCRCGALRLSCCPLPTAALTHRRS